MTRQRQLEDSAQIIEICLLGAGASLFLAALLNLAFNFYERIFS